MILDRENFCELNKELQPQDLVNKLFSIHFQDLQELKKTPELLLVKNQVLLVELIKFT